MMMQCGHAPNGTNSKGEPCCVICMGFYPDARAETVWELPDLTGRMAKCTYNRTCKSEVESKATLPFWEYRATADSDRYYCGCHGWD